MDPGNFATNIQGGAQFGYELLWVILGSNLMAMLLQSLSAKLGIATGQNLSRALSKPIFTPGCDRHVGHRRIGGDCHRILAEFLGAAFGIRLLFGIPLWVAGLLTAVVTFLILGLERYGFRLFEAVITAFIAVIAVCYLAETILARPDIPTVLYYTLVPHFSGTESMLFATGILGTTVMPHALYLHSTLTQDRIVTKNPKTATTPLPFELADIFIPHFDVHTSRRIALAGPAAGDGSAQGNDLGAAGAQLPRRGHPGSGREARTPLRRNRSQVHGHRRSRPARVARAPALRPPAPANLRRALDRRALAHQRQGQEDRLRRERLPGRRALERSHRVPGANPARAADDLIPETLAESLRQMKASKKRQGELLVEMGALSPYNLSRALVLQMEAKLLEVFAWREGRFAFIPK